MKDSVQELVDALCVMTTSILAGIINTCILILKLNAVTSDIFLTTLCLNKHNIIGDFNIKLNVMCATGLLLVFLYVVCRRADERESEDVCSIWNSLFSI